MPTKQRSTPERLNRYTSLPALIDVLSGQRITLLSPGTWEDRNDAYYLERYKEVKAFKSVLAVCFSLRKDTFHHWRIFSGGSAGVCIEFDMHQLLSQMPDRGFRHGKVKYRLIRSVKKRRPTISAWPFLKRMPFKDEGEYRIIFESKTESTTSKSVPIDLSCVRKVTLSPWLHGDLAPSVIQTIKKIDGCADLAVNRSHLVSNAQWAAAIDL